MELGPVWAEWGLVGLFLAAYLAATILPFSSEAVLLALAAAGGQPMPLFLVATLGNTLGGLTNYGIGRWLPIERVVQRYGADTLRAERWKAYTQRHGAWAALLCWLPVVGDPLALALGLARTAILPTAILMMLGKGARYAVLLWATDRIITG